MKQFVCDIACVCHMWMAWSQQIKYLQEIDFLKSFSRFQFDLHEKEKSGWFTGLVIVLRTESQEICLANIIFGVQAVNQNENCFSFVQGHSAISYAQLEFELILESTT